MDLLIFIKEIMERSCLLRVFVFVLPRFLFLFCFLLQVGLRIPKVEYAWWTTRHLQTVSSKNYAVSASCFFTNQNIILIVRICKNNINLVYELGQVK